MSEERFNEEDVRKFYKFLKHTQDTELRIQSKNKKVRKTFVGDEEEFVKVCKEEVEKGSNIWVGIRDRFEGSTEENVISSNYIFVDIDTDVEEGSKKVKELCEKNNIKIGLEGFSGGGYHFYIPHDLVVLNDEQRNKYKDNVLGKFKKILKNENIEIDEGVFDLSRVMRVLGTFNNKEYRQKISEILFLDENVDVVENTKNIKKLLESISDEKVFKVEEVTKVLEKYNIEKEHPWLFDLITKGIIIQPNTGRNDVVVKYSAMICEMYSMIKSEWVSIADAICFSCKDSSRTTFQGWLGQVKNKNKFYDGYKNHINSWIKKNKYPLRKYILTEEEQEQNRLFVIQRLVDDLEGKDEEEQIPLVEHILGVLSKMNRLVRGKFIEEIIKKTGYKKPDIEKKLKDIEKANRVESIKKINEQKNIEDNRVELILPKEGKLISKFAEEVSELIKDENLLFFKPNCREVVEVTNIEVKDEKKDDIKTYTGFSSIRPNRFITLLEKYAIPGREYYDKVGNSFFVEKSISSDLGNTLLASEILQNKLPKIDRIFTVPIPIILKDGKTLTFPKKGYDERFNSWLPYDSPEIKEGIPLEEAKEKLREIYKEFCFQTKQDYTNAISGLLTPFLKGLFSSFNVRTPIVAYLANRERAGKDYCAGITGIVYEGVDIRDPAISTEDRNSQDEEIRKRLASHLICGRRRLHFENNKGKLSNTSIEGFATSSIWANRLLGKNDIIVSDNETDLSLSGNIGITFSPDMANRCIFVKLFLEIEDANSIRYKTPNLHEKIRNERSYILSCLFSLVKNWFDSGCKEGSVPFTSFSEWANICGGIMESAGYDSPCLKDESDLTLECDKDTSNMKDLFEMMYEKYPEKIIKIDVIKQVIMENHLFGYFDLQTNRSDQVKFGNEFMKNIGRIYSDIRLECLNPKKQKQWREYQFTKIKKEKENVVY